MLTVWNYAKTFLFSLSFRNRCQTGVSQTSALKFFPDAACKNVRSCCFHMSELSQSVNTREQSSYQTKRDRRLRPVSYYLKLLDVRICDRIVCAVTCSGDHFGFMPCAAQSFVSRKVILALATCSFLTCLIS